MTITKKEQFFSAIWIDRLKLGKDERIKVLYSSIQGTPIDLPHQGYLAIVTYSDNEFVGEISSFGSVPYHGLSFSGSLQFSFSDILDLSLVGIDCIDCDINELALLAFLRGASVVFVTFHGAQQLQKQSLGQNIDRPIVVVSNQTMSALKFSAASGANVRIGFACKDLLKKDNVMDLKLSYQITNILNVDIVQESYYSKKTHEDSYRPERFRWLKTQRMCEDKCPI